MIFYSSGHFNSVGPYGYFLNIYSLFLGFKTIHKDRPQKRNQYWNVAGACRDGLELDHEPKLRTGFM